MVNLDRILQQKTPCAGQIDTILYVKQAPAREAVVDGLKELAKLKRCGRERGPIDAAVSRSRACAGFARAPFGRPLF